MNFEKFDKIIWRTIGSFIVFGCIGAGLIAIVATLRGGDDKSTQEFRTADKNDEEKNLLLGGFEPLKGTDLSLSSLGHGAESYKLSSDYSNGYIVNYFLIDKKTKAGQWLWKKNEWKVHKRETIYDSIDETKQKTIAFLIDLYETDSNKDGVIDSKDNRSLLYYDLSTRSHHFLMKDLDRKIGYEQANADEIMVYYIKDQRSFYMVYNLKTKKVQETEISLPKAD